jgi:hypothetical protein
MAWEISISSAIVSLALQFSSSYLDQAAVATLAFPCLCYAIHRGLSIQLSLPLCSGRHEGRCALPLRIATTNDNCG